MSHHVWLLGLIFQSTLPRGERLRCNISIKMLYNFNPRSHEGSDSLRHSLTVHLLEFQSTLPRGERLISPPRKEDNTHFNPRSHEGSDSLYLYNKLSRLISIHAPTRGATGKEVSEILVRTFQSTLPRGERLQILPVKR